PVFEQLGGQVAVVGEQDQSGRGVFEVADRVDALGESAEAALKRLAAFGVGHGGDDFGGLVEREVDRARSFFYGAAGGFDAIDSGVGLGAQFGDDFAVDAHLTAENQLLGVAARGDSCTGDNFL